MLELDGMQRVALAQRWNASMLSKAKAEGHAGGDGSGADVGPAPCKHSIATAVAAAAAAADSSDESDVAKWIHRAGRHEQVSPHHVLASSCSYLICY